MQKNTNSVNQNWVAVDFFDCILLGSMDLNNILQDFSFLDPQKTVNSFSKQRNETKRRPSHAFSIIENNMHEFYLFLYLYFISCWRVFVVENIVLGFCYQYILH